MEYFVYIDASHEELCWLLMKQGDVVYYDSKKLKAHENNYATYELELVVIVHVLKMWKHYLLGSKFELRDDHHSLKYLFEQPNMSAQQAR